MKMTPIQTMAGLLLLSCIVFVLVPKSNALTCMKCNRAKCTPPEGCNHGTTGDICGCCDRCASGPGEQCGGIWGQDGKCKEGLGCSQTRSSQKPGVCVPAAEAAEV